MNRIFVTGPVGSGKTTFAKRLSKKLKISFYSTDDMFYNYETGLPYSSKKRGELMRRVLKKRKWIIEGTANSGWKFEALKKAEKIIVLDFDRKTLFKRILERFKEGRKKMNLHGELRSLCRLWCWAFKHRQGNYMISRKYIGLKRKMIILDCSEAVNKFLGGIY